MASNKPLKNIFTWGETVQVNKDAPQDLNPLKIGSVCGIRSIDTDKLAKKLEMKVGNILYLVEFSDGKSFEIPECYLSKIDG
jgi:hypothetical protein